MIYTTVVDDLMQPWPEGQMCLIGVGFGQQAEQYFLGDILSVLLVFEVLLTPFENMRGVAPNQFGEQTRILILLELPK